MSDASPDPNAWPQRLAYILETMREMSSQSDPQEMVQTYGDRIGRLVPHDRYLSLSRRELERPMVRLTRSSLFDRNINPWREQEKLPILDRGLLSDLIWSDEPAIIDDLQLAVDDPSEPFLRGLRSLLVLPLFDRGVALNMVVLGRSVANGFERETLPEQVWMSNLFGRATHNLVLSQELQKAYDTLDRELRLVAEIQRSLLPTQLPVIPSIDLAVHYQTSKRAGGDYYDFFPLPQGCWGLLLADVSGHGTPAAVIMAVTHSIAHTLHGQPTPPSRLLGFVNHHLTQRYTSGKGTFVTAFYAVYDPRNRTLVYCSAGHNPPRIRRSGDGIVESLDQSRQLPLGIEPEQTYQDCTVSLGAGDAMLMYTDGVTEARNAEGEFFGMERLDEALLCSRTSVAAELLADILRRLRQFTHGTPPNDDRTLLAVTVL